MTSHDRMITLLRPNEISVGVNCLGTTKGGIHLLTVTPTVANTVVTVMMTRGAMMMDIMMIGP